MRLRYLAPIGVEQTTKLEGPVSETGRALQLRETPPEASRLPRSLLSVLLATQSLTKSCHTTCPGRLFVFLTKRGHESFFWKSFRKSGKLLTGIKPMLPQDCVGIAARQEIR